MSRKMLLLISVSFISVSFRVDAVAQVTASGNDCNHFSEDGKRQTLGGASNENNDATKVLHEECDDKDYDIIGASKVREGAFERLQEPETASVRSLDPKRALIGNRFENGTRKWREESENFENTLDDQTNYRVSDAYQAEITAIGGSDGYEVDPRYSLADDDTRLQLPPRAAAEQAGENIAPYNGVLPVDQASLLAPSSIENNESIVRSPRARPVEIYQGKGVATSLDLGDDTHAMSLNDVLSQAATHAPQIAVFRELPAIRETSVLEAKGRFKSEVFVEARYEDRDIPTTSLAQTAGDDRLREDDFATEFGIRKRVRSGAEVTLSQRFSSLDTNLIEFSPSEQSRSRTVLSVRQPILRGGGFSFNRALDNVAKLETDVAVQEFRRQSENHLLEVTRAYWNLYLARAVALSEAQSVERIDNVVSRVENRRNIDAQRLQVTRARAARAEQRSSLVRARNAVRNAEARLRALVGSPQIIDSQTKELIPQDVPAIVWKDLSIENTVSTASQKRPEIMQAKYQHKASIIRRGIAANEALPQLDLIVEGSINGREDNFNFGGAFDDATSEGDYLVGLRFSMPIGRDERKARHKRRRLEEVQQRRQIETTLNSLKLETEISINEYAVSYEEFVQRKDALELAQQDYEILKERWQRGAGDQGVVYLDMLIDANRRLLTAQGELNEAIVTFKYAEANLERSRGQYLNKIGYRIVRNTDRNGTSGYTLERTQ